MVDRPISDAFLIDERRQSPVAGIPCRLARLRCLSAVTDLSDRLRRAGGGVRAGCCAGASAVNGHERVRRASRCAPCRHAQPCGSLALGYVAPTCPPTRQARRHLSSRRGPGLGLPLGRPGPGTALRNTRRQASGAARCGPVHLGLVPARHDGPVALRLDASGVRRELDAQRVCGRLSRDARCNRALRFLVGGSARCAKSLKSLSFLDMPQDNAFLTKKKFTKIITIILV